MSRRRGILLLIVLPAVASLLATLGIMSLITRANADDRVLIMPTISSTSQPVPLEARVATGDDGAAAQAVEAAKPGSDSPSPGADEGACENIVHLVVSGETLGAISRSYDVSLEDLIEANQIVDPDFDPDILDVDQEIIVPVCTMPTASAPPTSTPRPIPTPIPTLTPAPLLDSDVIISRIAGVGELYNEVIEVFNEGSTIDLEGWQIRVGEEGYEFPAIRLFSGGSVLIHTSRGENTASDLYWGLTSPVLSPGATVELLDDDGTLRDSYGIE